MRRHLAAAVERLRALDARIDRLPILIPFAIGLALMAAVTLWFTSTADARDPHLSFGRPAAQMRVVDEHGQPRQPEQRWLDTAAEISIDFGPYTAQVIYGGCPDDLRVVNAHEHEEFSCVPWKGDRIYLLPLKRADRRVHLMHEAAHIWQFHAPPALVGAVTARFREINGYTGAEFDRTWEPIPDFGHPRASVGELLADAIAWCAINAYWSWRFVTSGYGPYGWRPTPARANATCRMIRRNLPKGA